MSAVIACQLHPHRSRTNLETTDGISKRVRAADLLFSFTSGRAARRMACAVRSRGRAGLRSCADRQPLRAGTGWSRAGCRQSRAGCIPCSRPQQPATEAIRTLADAARQHGLSLAGRSGDRPDGRGRRAVRRACRLVPSVRIGRGAARSAPCASRGQRRVCELQRRGQHAPRWSAGGPSNCWRSPKPAWAASASIRRIACRPPSGGNLATRCARQHPDVRFLAATPGLARGDLLGLEGAGFDSVFSSVRWWDFRASWMVGGACRARAHRRADRLSRSALRHPPRRRPRRRARRRHRRTGLPARAVRVGLDRHRLDDADGLRVRHRRTDVANARRRRAVRARCSGEAHSICPSASRM